MKVMKSATKELYVRDENSFEKNKNIFRQTSKNTIKIFSANFKKYENIFGKLRKERNLFSATFEKERKYFRQSSKFGRVRKYENIFVKFRKKNIHAFH